MSIIAYFQLDSYCNQAPYVYLHFVEKKELRQFDHGETIFSFYEFANIKKKHFVSNVRFHREKAKQKKRFRCAIEFQADYIKATNVNDCIPSSEIVKRYSGIPRESHENWIKHRNLNERFCCLSKLNRKNRVYTRVPSRIFIVTTSLLCSFFFSLIHLSSFRLFLFVLFIRWFFCLLHLHVIVRYTHMLFLVFVTFTLFFIESIDVLLIFFFSLSSRRSSCYYWCWCWYWCYRWYLCCMFPFLWHLVLSFEQFPVRHVKLIASYAFE